MKSSAAHSPESAASATRSMFKSVGNTFNSLFNSYPESNRPNTIDFTSQEALEEYKKYNTETNLRVQERRMWGGVAERTVGALLTGATIGIGSAVVVSFGWIGGLVALGTTIATSVVVFYAVHQSATREQSDKGMDVSDYTLKRSAGLIAKEIRKALDEDRKLSQATDQPAAILHSNDNAPQNTVNQIEMASTVAVAEAPTHSTSR